MFTQELPVLTRRKFKDGEKVKSAYVVLGLLIGKEPTKLRTALGELS
jgi:hypothetical protein